MSDYRIKPMHVKAVQWKQPGDHPDVIFINGRYEIECSGGPSRNGKIDWSVRHRCIEIKPNDWIVTFPDTSINVFNETDFDYYFEPVLTDALQTVYEMFESLDMAKKYLEETAGNFLLIGTYKFIVCDLLTAKNFLVIVRGFSENLAVDYLNKLAQAYQCNETLVSSRKDV